MKGRMVGVMSGVTVLLAEYVNVFCVALPVRVALSGSVLYGVLLFSVGQPKVDESVAHPYWSQ